MFNIKIVFKTRDILKLISEKINLKIIHKIQESVLATLLESAANFTSENSRTLDIHIKVHQNYIRHKEFQK